MFSTFSSNTEAKASELLENFEEMFPCYYMHSDIHSMLKDSNKEVCCKGIKVGVLVFKRS